MLDKRDIAELIQAEDILLDRIETNDKELKRVNGDLAHIIDDNALLREALIEAAEAIDTLRDLANTCEYSGKREEYLALAKLEVNDE